MSEPPATALSGPGTASAPPAQLEPDAIGVTHWSPPRPSKASNCLTSPVRHCKTGDRKSPQTGKKGAVAMQAGVVSGSG
jgi:hypothetical protein